MEREFMNRPAQLRRGLIALAAAAVFGLMATPAHAAEVEGSTAGTAERSTVATMGQASPSTDCYALAASPYRNGSNILFDGWLSCVNYNQWNTAVVSVMMYANGGRDYIGKTERRCQSDLDGKTCWGNTAATSYRSGNWCTVVEARIWPSLNILQDKTCKQI
ncbi:MAG TPA: hypothetical protein VGP57_15965 [Actinoplanes sp.]|nr:hypothetical protein [Actinoplanes sp.]